MSWVSSHEVRVGLGVGDVLTPGGGGGGVFLNPRVSDNTASRTAPGCYGLVSVCSLEATSVEFLGSLDASLSEVFYEQNIVDAFGKLKISSTIILSALARGKRDKS